MKKINKLISLLLIASVIFGCFIPFSVSAKKKIVYSNNKGTAKVVCGKFKKTFNAKDYKYKKKPSFSKALNEALKVAGKKATDKTKAKVTISKGYYTFDRTILIYSNTELVAKNCVTRYKGTHIRARFDKDKESAKGYSGARNITITGGTWDAAIPYKNASKIGKTNEKLGSCTFRFAHCKNIVVRNATFIDNYTNHDIELGGDDGVTIYGCTFYNNKSTNNIDAQGTESIQLDVCHKTAMPSYPAYDYTACKNVVIRNNTFKNKLRAIGSHHAVPGMLYENIKIYGNKMNNIGGIAINGMYWANSEIYDNTLKDVGSGIDIISFGDHNMYNEKKKSYAAIVDALKQSKTYIYNNEISVRKTGNVLEFRFGVRARGTDCTTALKNKNKGVPNGIYKIYNAYLGVDKKGDEAPNEITGAFNAGVMLHYAADSQMNYNTVNLNTCDYNTAFGLYADHCENAEINANTVEVTTKTVSSTQRSGATIRGGEKIELIDNDIQVTDYGVQLLFGSTDVTVRDNEIVSKRLNSVYLSGKEDPTPNKKKKIAVYDNYLDSPNNSAEDISIKIILANVDIIDYNNGDIMHWYRGSDSVPSVKIKDIEFDDFYADCTADKNTLEWAYDTKCSGFLVYRVDNGVKTLIADTDKTSLEDNCSVDTVYELVPYIISDGITVYGEPQVIDAIKYSEDYDDNDEDEDDGNDKEENDDEDGEEPEEIEDNGDLDDDDEDDEDDDGDEDDDVDDGEDDDDSDSE